MSNTTPTIDPRTVKRQAWKVRPMNDAPWLFVRKLDEFESMMGPNDLEDATYEVVPILMSDEEFDKLGEFDGW